ncbi:MAG: HPP family protein [Chromatiales bacterium]
MAERLTKKDMPPRPPLRMILVTFIGAFIGMSLVASIEILYPSGWMLTIGSFGATAVLLYAIPGSALAQPRNLFGGHLVSAIAGILVYHFITPELFPAAPLAVALAIAFMQLTRTLHPPGGATALIAVIGPQSVHDLGWAYLVPVMAGVTLLFLAALLVHNINERGSYPHYWG